MVTHLDAFKENKTLRHRKKAIKQRFWTEVYQGAKVFNIPGLSNGKYPKTEVQNICLYISRMKTRPLTWRNTHPFLLVDRMEDITDPKRIDENPNCKRDLSLYGYVQGCNLKNGQAIHLLGVGDYSIKSLSRLPDPCPLPERDPEKKGRRKLSDKEVLLYAPMSNVGKVEVGGCGEE